ncbi:hypothetical protein [Staphylococcus saprophyticus]|uniref:hypothetical protein n=1 Tax=Staphylococcus saprophyticus TaxID=29385 RepID=UPI002B268097|nr:hypothetical protein [Staphylococcus saprophyticus]
MVSFIHILYIIVITRFHILSFTVWDAVEQHTEQLEKRRIEQAQKTKQANSKVFGRDTRESENERERTRSNNIKIERDDEGLSR